jgi:hypothetical protein
MQQRRLRLGDVLDDYCPRERRITNHVVLAMIDDQVKQTRCTTCDADHEYKQARVPAARRKKLEGGALADAPEALLRARSDAEGEADTDRDVDADATEEIVAETGAEDVPADSAETDAAAPADTTETDAPPVAASGDDEGPVHRRLIRATLPRPEGQVPERKLPDFTIRQPGGRGGREFEGNKNGQRPGRRPMRFGGTRTGPGQGPRQGSGQGQGQGGPRHGSGSGQRPPGNRPGHGQRGGGRPGQGPGQGGRGGGGRKRGR